MLYPRVLCGARSDCCCCLSSTTLRLDAGTSSSSCSGPQTLRGTQRLLLSVPSTSLRLNAARTHRRLPALLHLHALPPRTLRGTQRRLLLSLFDNSPAERRMNTPAAAGTPSSPCSTLAYFAGHAATAAAVCLRRFSGWTPAPLRPHALARRPCVARSDCYCSLSLRHLSG